MTPTATIERPQHLEALARGNAKRMARAQLRRDVEAGAVDVRDLIRNPPDTLTSSRQSVTVFELLCWQKRWGPARSKKFIAPLRLTLYTTPFDLSQTRREQIVRALG